MIVEPQMNADERRLAINEIASRIIGAAFAVSNELGVGFLEKVYENALAHEIRKSGLEAKQQWPIDVWYDGIVVGQYIADILVEDLVIVEAKAVKALDDIHLAQCLNYLKATKRSLCLLLNFGQSRIEVKRIVNHF
jgi:GxxExxY protein